ncbi:MAG: hypothetical protein J7K40_06650 [candidate division Zixibacteria bacterium]|nr:hypothetical protein [candidate division Zixibacteria bacterium]
MDKYKIYNLIDTLQELPRTPPDNLAKRVIDGINAFFQPTAAMVKIVFPDKRIFQHSIGDISNQELLKHYEKQMSGLDVNSAQFVIEKEPPQVISVVGLKRLDDFSGGISVMVDDFNPFKHILRQVIELFINNISLALTMQSLERKIELDKLLVPVYADIKRFEIEYILAYYENNPQSAILIGAGGHQQFILPKQLPQMITVDSGHVSPEHKKGICDLLPSNLKFRNIDWDSFTVGGSSIKALFAGNFKNRQIIFSKFRSLISDIDFPTSYHETIEAFKLLKKDHTLIVKGEKIAAILETAVAINHEINNPLTAILGNAQLLLLHHENMPKEIKSKIDIIEKSAFRIRSVTQKLMAVIEPITTSYSDNLDMLDIDKSIDRIDQDAE